MKSIKAVRLISVLLVTVMCFTLFSFSTAAVSLDRKGSITLTVIDKDSKEPISGAVFRAYCFATACSDGDGISYIYTDEFRNNGMDMGNFSDAYLPVHLMTYAVENSLEYTEKVSDSSGRVTFDNLPCGAYLVVPVLMQEGYLNPSPFIVAIPMRDETNNSWIYNIDATPKIEGDKDDSGEKTYISVKKLWQSAGKTPDSIAVALIKDGTVIDTVVLDAANNWYHRWDDLDKNHSWSVIETDVPKGYKVTYITSQMTVIITNTADDYEEETTTSPDETTTATDTTLPEDSTTSPTGTTKPTGTTESTTKPEELIDTGQLNWPIPVFSVAGLLLFSIGWSMLNFGKKDEEEA